ncbi:MAG: phosphoribosylanthranilate isomerase [Desulfobacterales bacterium]
MSTEAAPQVKICGITRIEDALSCVRCGADALGFVFFPKSPRCVSVETTKAIISRLPKTVTTVGVFVDASFNHIKRSVETCGLDAVQLHGRESPEMVRRLGAENLIVIKTLFSKRPPYIDEMLDFDASAVLAECGRGDLPGGNALAWNWSEAGRLNRHHPLILAGGLTPENVRQAVRDAQPDAVDVSSGVELLPGRKNPEKIKAFVERVRDVRVLSPKKIFG